MPMQDIVHPKGKVYYSMGEVAEMFDVNPSLLRYWEKEFDILKPHRNKKGNRLFTPQDVDNIKVIYHLLKEKKMKIEVARKYMKDNRRDADRDAAIVEKLMSIRSMLRQIKQDVLHGAADDDEPDEEAGGEAESIAAKAGRRGKSAQVASSKEAEMAGSAVPAKKAQKASEAASGVTDIFEQELTISAIISEEASGAGEKLPFREQMLFEVVASEAGTPTLEGMIDSFLSKNYGSGQDDARGSGSGEGQVPDPFAAFAGGRAEGEVTADAEQEKPKIIEQTLF